MTFKTKLNMALWSLLVVPISIFTFFTYRYLIVEHQSNTVRVLNGTLLEIAANIRADMNVITHTADILMLDNAFQIEHNAFTPLEGFRWFSREVDPRVRASMQQLLLDTRIVFYLDNPTIPQIYYKDSEAFPDRFGPKPSPLTTRRFEVIRYERMKGAPWFDDLITNEVNAAWRQIGDDTQHGNISYVKAIYSKRSLKRIGYIRIIVSAEDIFMPDSLLQIPFDHYFCVSCEDTLVFDWNIAKPHGEDILLQADVLPTVKAILAIPLAQISRSAINAGQGMLITAVGCAILLFALGMYFSRYFARRMNLITEAIRGYRDASKVHFLIETGNDEFDLTAKAFNEMTQENKQLYEASVKASLAQKDAELHMLQAQINPHFLYNILSSISQLARADRPEDVQKMAMMLAHFYRMTLSKKEMVIPLREEFDQIAAYTDILKVKYLDRLRVDIQYPPSLQNLQTPSFILQPFVENSIIHGWAEEHLCIWIAGVIHEDAVLITITDNGLGMDEDTLGGIQSDMGVSERYGIRNVNERIRLLYGKEYGVDIWSAYGQGTRITVTIPALPYPGRDESVPADAMDAGNIHGQGT